MKQNQDPGNKYMYIWSTDISQGNQEYSMDNKQSQ